MGCITFVLLVLNIIALVAIDIMFWAESAASGLAGVFGIIAFFIGYAFLNIIDMMGSDIFKGIYIFVIAFITDTYAYISGMLIGKHRY